MWQILLATLHLCHSERGEESPLIPGEILRYAQDDGRRACQKNLPHAQETTPLFEVLVEKLDDQRAGKEVMRSVYIVVKIIQHPTSCPTRKDTLD